MDKMITATISCTYGWNPGVAPLTKLRPTHADVGFTRQEITGTVDDFKAAIAEAKWEYATAKGSHRTALTRLVQRLEGAIFCQG